MLYKSVRSYDSDSGKMRGFIVTSKNKSEGDEISNLGITLSNILKDLPSVRFMSDLSDGELKDVLTQLNTEMVKIHLFKFVHDLHMVFGNIDRITDLSIGNGTLSNDFYNQIDLLRKSCNDYDGLKAKISKIIGKDEDDLVQMFEYMVPGYSLDIITLVIIAIGAQEYSSQRLVCQKVYELEVFKLLRWKPKII